MKALIFDTETTGLPVSYKNALDEPGKWPHIVSISWILLDTDTNTILKKENYYVIPEWDIPAESIAIHHVTPEYARKHGLPLKVVMKKFMDEECDCMIAHNMQFDYNVVMNAIYWDCGFPIRDLHKKRHCSMNLMKNICKLPSLYGKGFKSPKLSELYEYTFHRKPEEHKLHGSMYDVEILTEIVQHSSDLRKGLFDLPITNVVQPTPKNELRSKTVPDKVFSLRF